MAADKMVNSYVQSVLQGDKCPLRANDYLLESDKFVPLTKQSMCYIVSVTIVDDQDRILLIQEAKKSCRGKWYLPAGRVEPNETLVEAAQREVTEEAGYECQPTTLLSVETQGPTWMRLNFTAEITGGELKTTKQADEESLQAGWFTKKDILFGIQLRYKDILPVIDQALTYKQAIPTRRHACLLPHIVPHTGITFKCVLIQCLAAVVDGKGCSDIHMVEYAGQHSGGNTSGGLPAVSIMQRDFYILQRLLEKIFVVKAENEKGLLVRGSSKFRFRCHGVLSVEHSGKPKHMNDGVCITLLVEVGTELDTELFSLQDQFRWKRLEGDKKEVVENRMKPLGSVAFMQLHV